MANKQGSSTYLHISLETRTQFQSQKHPTTQIDNSASTDRHIQINAEEINHLYR